jgi:hypothetical protein
VFFTDLEPYCLRAGRRLQLSIRRLLDEQESSECRAFALRELSEAVVELWLGQNPQFLDVPPSRCARLAAYAGLDAYGLDGMEETEMEALVELAASECHVGANSPLADDQAELPIHWAFSLARVGSA